MTEVTPEVADRFTGQRRVTTTDAASRELREAERAKRRAASTRRWRLLRWLLLMGAAGFFAFWRWLATLPERRSWPRLAVMFACCCVLAIVSVPIVSVISSGNLLAVVGAYTLSFLAILLQPLVLPEDTSRVKRAGAFWATMAQESEARLKAADGEPRAKVIREADARQVYGGIRRAVEAPLQRLLTSDFRAMSGTEFEGFLCRDIPVAWVLCSPCWPGRRSGRRPDRYEVGSRHRRAGEVLRRFRK